jgi:hypothetical protein
VIKMARVMATKKPYDITIIEVKYGEEYAE